MKLKRLFQPWFALILTAQVSFAQSPGATIIRLENTESTEPYLSNPIFVWDPATVGLRLAPVRGSFAQVFVRPEGSIEGFTLVPGLEGLNLTFFTPGFFHGGIVEVPRVAPGVTGEWFVRAWHGAPTWEEAQTTPSAFIGQSTVFRNPTGIMPSTGVPDPPSLFNTPSFTMFPVPEPSSLVLLSAGLAMFLAGSKRYFRRN